MAVECLTTVPARQGTLRAREGEVVDMVKRSFFLSLLRMVAVWSAVERRLGLEFKGLGDSSRICRVADQKSIPLRQKGRVCRS